ncbi:hypothetical protein KAX06_07115 [candidate division WOR-3 bacterium]|nr:hypothetical protein [candidate division WOR-3 bacterium]
MKQRGSWLKIILVLAVAFAVAGLLHGLLQGAWFSGMGLKVAFLAAVLGFVVLSWNEEGFFYALGSAVVLSAMVAVAGRSPASPLLRGLYALLYFALFAGLMYLGDWVSRRIIFLRAVVSFAGGVIAGVIMVYLLPLISRPIANFMKDMQGNLISAIETTGGVAIGILVARLIGGAKKGKEGK